MARKNNRKRKGRPPVSQGTRAPSGRKRDRTPVAVGPCDGVARRQASFARTVKVKGGKDKIITTESTDAIGRAWSKGLLGEEPLATHRRDFARKLQEAYRVVFWRGARDSLSILQPQTGGLVDSDKAAKRERWMKDRLACVHPADKRAFDDLVIDFNVDSGPGWLDRLCDPKADEGKRASDREVLNRAVRGLDAAMQGRA